MTLEEALRGKEIPEEIRRELVVVSVPYWSFEGEVNEGELVVHKDVANEVTEIFKELCSMRFPIQQIVPVVRYAWDDDASMAANNTSAFNYRVIYGQNANRLSNHSYGRAIDINPLLNPYVYVDGRTAPTGVIRDSSRPGTLTPEIARAFTARGWTWGGDWNPPDWQHFEKAA